MKPCHALTSDPDVVQAIEDLRPTVLEIRDRSKALLSLMPELPAHRDRRLIVLELVSGIALRAERIGMTTDELLAVINADIDGRGAARMPSGDELAEAVAAARERERDAHVALSAAQTEMRLATAARLSAERAVIAHAAGCSA